MADSGQGDAATPAQSARPGEGLSQVVGKILDQLSLSAWLPAAMLVGVGSVLAQLHNQDRPDLGAAVISLTDEPLGILVVLLFALVLSTLITQAFEFEVIRLLEGYWGASRVAGKLAAVRISAHVNRRSRLDAAVDRLRLDAFSRARLKMLEDGIERILVDILESDLTDGDTTSYPADKVREARSMGWRPSASAVALRQLDATALRLDAYPEQHRVLPTRLGNSLRSAEDSLRRADGGDLQGFVMRNYQNIPAALLSQQAQFRTRLDMYCSLVLVSAALSAASLAALWKFGPAHAAGWIASTALVAMAALSYRAAVSSAGGYGVALRAIDAEVTRRRAAPTTP